MEKELSIGDVEDLISDLEAQFSDGVELPKMATGNTEAATCTGTCAQTCTGGCGVSPIRQPGQ